MVIRSLRSRPRERGSRTAVLGRRACGFAALGLTTAAVGAAMSILATAPAGAHTRVNTRHAPGGSARQHQYFDGVGIAPGAIKHVWLIILENKSYDATFTGLNDNTYLWQTLPSQGVLLKNYYATGHSSQDNYTSLVSGQAPQPDVQDDCVYYDNDNNAATAGGVATDQGVDLSGAVLNRNGTLNWPATYTANPNYGQWTSGAGANAYLTTNGCVYPSSVQTLFNQFDAAGISWKGYAQDLGDTSNSGASGASNLTLDEDACGAPYDNASATTWPYASPGSSYTVAQSNPGAASASGAYVPKHFPLPWFASLLDSPRDCNSAHVGPMFDDPVSETAGQNTGDFWSDLQSDSKKPDSYPNFVWITPDNCSDAHDAECVNGGAAASTELNGYDEGGNLSGGFSAADIPNNPTNGTGGLYAADQFLGHVIPEIEASSEFKDGGLIDVTFDEGYPAFTYSNSFYNDSASNYTQPSGDGLGARVALSTDAAGETLDIHGRLHTEHSEPTGPNTPLVTDPLTGQQMSPGPGDNAGLDRPDNCVAQNAANTVTISDYDAATNTPGVCILGPQASTPGANTAGAKVRTDSVTGLSGSSTIQDNSIRVTDEGRGVSGTDVPSGAYVGTVTDGPLGSCTSASSCSPTGLNPAAIAVAPSSTGLQEEGFFTLVDAAGNPISLSGPVTSITLAAACDPTPADQGGPSTACTGSIADPYYDSNAATPGGGDTGSVLISPYIKPGTTSSVYYNHYSWLRTMEDLFGVASASPGLDGLGHIGYAAQPGLVPFGRDVFNNATPRRNVGRGGRRHRSSGR